MRFRLSLDYFWLKMCLHDVAPTVAMRWTFRSDAERKIGKLRFTFDFMSRLVSLAMNLLLRLISADTRDELCGHWDTRSAVTMGRWNWRRMYPWSMKWVQKSAQLINIAYRRGGGEGLQMDKRLMSHEDILRVKARLQSEMKSWSSQTLSSQGLGVKPRTMRNDIITF